MCTNLDISVCILQINRNQGRIQDFKLGGGALKKIAPSRGRRELFWGISCEKPRFDAKKSYFSNIRGGGGGGGGGRAKFLGYFMWKITILRQKNHIFTNFRGGARRVRPPPPPPESAPGNVHPNESVIITIYKCNVSNLIQTINVMAYESRWRSNDDTQEHRVK